MQTNDNTTFDETRLAGMEARLETLSEDMAFLVKRQRQQSELIDELGPILKAVSSASITRLDEVEKRGYFAFGRGLVQVMDRLVEQTSEEDVQLLADNIVSITNTVRNLTQPDMLKLANEAAEAVAEADGSESTSLWAMLRQSRDDDVRRGLAVVLEVLRHIGRGSLKAGGKKKTKKDRLASRLAPRRVTRAPVARIEAPAAPRRPVAAKAAPRRAEPEDEACPDPNNWNEDMATQTASMLGIAEMTEEHWKLVLDARAAFFRDEASPNIRKLTKVAKVKTRDIYRLFPKAPGKTIARIAGIPKPGGCI